MNAYEIKLLTLAFQSFSKTGNVYFEFCAKNSDDLFYYTESARYLNEQEYIIGISDNIFSSSISPLSEQLICFEITDKGVKYIKDNA